MNKLLAALVAVGFALGSTAALAADAPAKDAGKDAKMAPAKIEKPADVKQADWDKMTDAEKQKAVEKAKMAKGGEKKKEKKGGC
jgi:Ni/Co efflux regulator RcnB